MLYLQTLIKKNKKLVHINLDSVGFYESQICLIGKAMRRAKSLVAIHLSDNPGTSERVTQFVQSLVHGRESLVRKNRKFIPKKVVYHSR